jgi:hypothetical protein
MMSLYFNEISAATGRRCAALQLVVTGYKQRSIERQALEEAGADAALIALETAGEQEALAKLEEIAQTALPSPGRGV